MTVSVLIPTVNRLALLQESLESARRQTHDDLEILVSDNGSTDRTREFVSEVAATDSRVRLLPYHSSLEMFANFNYLIEHSRGDAFCILADDDRLLPRFVETLLAPLAANPPVVASFCDHWIVTAAGERLPELSDLNTRQYGRSGLGAGRIADPLTVALRQSFSVCFALYRADVFRQELFDVTCGGAADVDYAIRAARAGDLYYVDERLAEYRAHAGTTTATRTAFMIDGAIRAYSKHSFPDTAHEQLRIGILRSKHRVRAVYACTRNRREWRQSVRMYRRTGGSLFHPGILLSCGLAMLPHPAGEAVRRALKAVRGWGVSDVSRRDVPEHD
jgi:glycosyltransferase involved in cell wall biosynthesis